MPQAAIGMAPRVEDAPMGLGCERSVQTGEMIAFSGKMRRGAARSRHPGSGHRLDLGGQRHGDRAATGLADRSGPVAGWRREGGMNLRKPPLLSE